MAKVVYAECYGSSAMKNSYAIEGDGRLEVISTNPKKWNSISQFFTVRIYCFLRLKFILLQKVRFEIWVIPNKVIFGIYACIEDRTFLQQNKYW